MSSSGSPPAAGGGPPGSSPPSHQGASDRGWHPAREWLEEDEEDEYEDMDYEPNETDERDDDDSDIEPYDDEDNDDDLDHIDVDGAHLNPELHLGNIQIEFAMDEPGQNGSGGENQGTRQNRVSAARLLNLLASNGLRHILHYNGLHETSPGEEEDDDYEFGFFGYRRRARRSGESKFPKVPSDEGQDLMRSGDFGRDTYYVDRLKRRNQALASKIMWRELGVNLTGTNRQDIRSMAQGLIPSSVADKVIHFDSRCYSGQFSDDGNFFFCCAQDFKVRMYDTSNPFDWKYYKTVTYPFGQWTITDASLSPDNKFLAYTSIRNLVCLAPTDPADESEPAVLDLSSIPGRRRMRFSGNSHFGIWSIRFSGDGREIVAGTSDQSVIVYDLETRQSVLRLQNHEDDVNAVCFGDQSSPHIIYSGSDDTTLRVWDRRSMGDGREAGVFMGHTEGLTYVDSKGDGRYVLSNGKDQTMKLWDLRKMMTTAKFDSIDVNTFTTGFDYRFESYPDDYYEPHPHDCSVVTYRGHRVLKTLIRCHFSPPNSTNSRYVYTGSEDGKVYVYNMDATLAGTIDVGQATHNSRPLDPDMSTAAYEIRSSRSDVLWKTCVRDASWHPSCPAVAATSWNGWGLSTGTCTLHTWNDGATSDEGSPPLARNYDSKLNPVPEYDDFKQTMAAMSRSRPVQRSPLDDELAYELW
ncbi:WD repeat protein [Aspergillus indologenus CBS 114.80]|uniref:WD repeat protein n=1 Tax=Aspergillus indologenus CBS 114.80 TaxID=1450541 RepID=A0A2V5I983_9EURO|nr:WD repeat protein [Aspergillus indologenus CBS 114.80]